jgi:hypothetical protein
MKKSKSQEGEVSSSAQPPGMEETKALNFKVPLSFHTELKTYAAVNRKSMTDVLQEGFYLLRDQKSN